MVNSGNHTFVIENKSSQEIKVLFMLKQAFSAGDLSPLTQKKDILPIIQYVKF